MRKIFVVLALLMFAAPALAGTVTLRLIQDMNDQDARIGELYYSTADASMSAFGLNITVSTANANIIDINNYFVGECGGPGNRGFGIFPANFHRYINPNSPNWSDPNYTPVADACDPGAAGTGLGTGTIIIEMGALYEDGNQPPLSGLLCRFRVDDDCNVSVTGNALRGNAVQVDASEATLNVAAATNVRIEEEGEPEGPACWYWVSHCKGNATDSSGGVGYVNLDDFTALRLSYLKTYKNDWNDGAGPYNPCADFDNTGKVNLDDFTILRINYLKTGSGCTPAAWPPPLID